MQDGFGLEVKRLRRRLEPEHKPWNDAALDQPWEELTPPLQPLTVFALKNIFFFSHATPVQRDVIPALSGVGRSVIAEAPTGSGKTLAFLVPMLERLVAASNKTIKATGRPLLSRNVIGFVLSPSRVLAEQTFVVARNLACRFPQNIHFVLCDNLVSRASQAAEHIRKSSRGAGNIIVATPADALEVLTELAKGDTALTTEVDAAALQGSGTSAAEQQLIAQLDPEKQALLAQQDEATRARYLKKLAAQQQAGGGKATPQRQPTTEQQSIPDVAPPRIAPVSPGEPIMMIIDEADVILREDGMRHDTMTLLNHIETALKPANVTAVPTPTTSKKGAKRARAEETTANPQGESKNGGSSIVDFGLCGATAGESDDVEQFSILCAERFGTRFTKVVHRRSEDFVSLIRNRFLLCEPHNLLSDLVHMINGHSSRKHFVFFNSSAVLVYVRDLFADLCHNTRPLLFVSKIFAMYEEMPEQSRFDEYNGFLQHANATASGKKKNKDEKKKPLSFAEEKNTHFQGGWKRSNGPPPATGAVLLCTDVAAFGLDVRDVDYVYHFEPPLSVESYIHRVGRVGRMGMRGTSMLLLPHTGVHTLNRNPHTPHSSSSTTALRQEETLRQEGGMTSSKGRSVVNARQPGASTIGQAELDVETLPEEKRAYLDKLGSLCNVEQWREPPGAPISANIRAVVSQHSDLQAQGIAAAAAMCTTNKGGASLHRWYDTPELAAQTLLLQ